MLMSQVKHKRNKAAIAILAAVVGTGVVTLNPTPNMDIAKQMFITIADVVMCIMLWDIYFDEELSKKTVQSFLSELCLITLSSIFTAYILAKGITAVMNYLTHALGSTGWGISGILAGMTTGFLGIGWAFYCDDWYRNSKSQK
jgi:predicted neutral ceramidase superfamily lipid hydrolase